MSFLRVGVIGLGVGLRHARAAAAHPGCELAAVADFSAAKLAEAGREFPGTRLLASGEELLALPGLDVVVVASYDDAHFAQVAGALAAGRHVFAEKPLCLFEEETAQVARLLRQRPGLRLSSNLGLRACPRFALLRERMAAGDLGRVYHLEADYFWGRREKLEGGWRAEMDYYSIIHGAAIHMVDLALWLTGRRPASVQALGSDLALRGGGQRHNDFAVLLLRFGDGLSAKVAAHGGCAHPHFHRVAVYGHRGTFAGELPGAYWLDSSDPAAAPRPEDAAYPGREERRRVFESFLDCLADPSARPMVDEADALAAMSVCHAAQRAVDTGCEAEISYLWEK